MPRRLLELFSGSGTLSSVFEEAGWLCVSVDNDPKCMATHCVDIMSFYYEQYPPGYFDLVHASVPCTEYSVAKTTGVRKLEEADELVRKSREIIRYFGTNWIIENPYTGLLKGRDVMADLRPYLKRVCYCKYGTEANPYLYRKETAIWTSIDWTPRPLCSQFERCEHYDHENGRHPAHAQKGPSGRLLTNNYRTRQLYSIPRSLCEEWLWAIEDGYSTTATTGSDVELTPVNLEPLRLGGVGEA